MQIECKKCIVSFSYPEDKAIPLCPCCGAQLTVDLAHDGKLDTTPTFIKNIVLRPLN